jgi:hypothetical protein
MGERGGGRGDVEQSEKGEKTLRFIRFTGGPTSSV